MFLRPERKKRIKHLVSNRQAGLVVVLEDLFDPHNAAAIFRTCDGLGIQEVHLVFDQQGAFNPLKIGKNSSSSANKWLTFVKHPSAKECFTKLKKRGYVVMGSALDAKAPDITTVDMTQQKMAIVFGNEHRGLSKDAIKHCDYLVKLPMKGMVESFNVSVAAALCIYEIVRQRQDSGKDFSLDEVTAQQLQKQLEEIDVERKIYRKKNR